MDMLLRANRFITNTNTEANRRLSVKQFFFSAHRVLGPNRSALVLSFTCWFFSPLKWMESSCLDTLCQRDTKLHLIPRVNSPKTRTESPFGSNAFVAPFERIENGVSSTMLHRRAAELHFIAPTHWSNMLLHASWAALAFSSPWSNLTHISPVEMHL